MIVVLCSAIPFVIAFLAVSQALRAAGSTHNHLALRLGLACGGAIAISSAGFSLGLYLYPPAASVIDAALELALLIFLLRRQRSFVAPGGPRAHETLRLILLGVALLAAARYFGEAAAQPHGAWDAWASWNLKARFFTRATDGWQGSFDPRLSFTHANYPLLMSGSVARTWKLCGEDPLVPQLHAFLFTLGTVVVTAGAVAAARGPNAGCLAATLALSGPVIHFGSWQYADVPLSFFLCAAAALLVLAEEDAERKRPLHFCAGAAAGMAAWTKHEGELFVLALFFVCALRWRRQVWPLVAGAAPWLLLSAWQRHLAPPDDYALWWSWHAARDHLADWPRHRQTLVAFGEQLTSFWPLLLVAGIGQFRRRSSAALPIALSLLVLLGGDYLALVTTPMELGWHLSTTVDRLVAQLHAPAILLVFLVAPPPEEWFQSLSSSMTARARDAAAASRS